MASDYDYDHFTQGTKWSVMVIGHSQKKNKKPKHED